MKKILVLPGTLWQVPIIKKLRQMGYEVININPYKDSFGFRYADQSIQLDIMEIEKCIEAIKDFNICAVISDECDIATTVVANIADNLELPGIGMDKAELFTNKYRMREFIKENGFEYPKFELAETKEEAYKFLKKIDKKMIIKPLDSNSSRGVHTIYTYKDLEKYFEHALSFSRKEKKVICEEYITGTEFTVDGVMTNLGHSTLAVSEKKHYSYNENIAYSLRFSYKNNKFDYDLLRKTNDEILNRTELPFGLTHVEYKYKDGKYYLIEMGARGGGNLISSDIVPIVSGIDTYEIYIKMALGETNNQIYYVKPEYKNREAILYFFDIPINTKGKHIREIKGIDYLEQSPNIVKYSINYKIGDRISEAQDDSKRFGYYIAYGESKTELDCIIKEVDKKFQVIIEE